MVQLNENDNSQGAQMAIFARTKLHLQSVAVFNDSGVFGQGVAANFTASACRYCIAMVGNTTALNPTADAQSAAGTPK